ncbi:MAG: hypothetical protein ABIK27_04575, partial [Bacteroidota bacterium]
TYGTLEETQSKLQEYKTFQSNFQVPIMCNEYGGANETQLTSYFRTEEIPYAPWGYKLSFNTPDRTPFYYILSNHTWRIELLNKISEYIQTNKELKNDILKSINESNLSNQCKQNLIDILNARGQLTNDNIRFASEKYPEDANELKSLSLKIADITFNYTVDALASILQAMNDNEMSELTESLQTKYWTKGIVPW